MTDRVHVYPAIPTMRLAHPVDGPLPPEGKRWSIDTFTRRRLADGGITMDKPAWLIAAEAAAPVAPEDAAGAA